MVNMVVKRDNTTQVPYERNKIYNAITKANHEVDQNQRVTDEEIDLIISCIESSFDGIARVEDIQNVIENTLMDMHKHELVRKYMTYRYQRELIRKSNSTDESIMGLLMDSNKDVAEENSNKKAVVNSTKRDLIAGEVSKDISRRLLLPKRIIENHDRGNIHFHDLDYFMMKEFNCCLPNFKDMLTNGTAINGVKIETPKSFRVACNQVTQIMAAISSNQYGGQTFYSDTLGRYLAYTRDKFRKRIEKNVDAHVKRIKDALGSILTPDISSAIDKKAAELIDEMVAEELKIELQAGIQCIQYQINTLMTCNGQSPFVTIFMYLRDDDPYLEENAMVIEEILRQRIKGIQNKDGAWITPAFPKLIYVLGKNNVTKDSRFYYLTKLAAECTAKRMYPDYISEKVMIENYDGEVFGCMGCVDGSSSIWYLDKTGTRPVEQDNSFEDFWNLMSRKFEVKSQNTKDKREEYIDLKNIQIWDTKLGYVDCLRVNRNFSYEWNKVEFENNVVVDCTQDHPFDTENRGIVAAVDLKPGDIILASTNGETTTVKKVVKYDCPEGKYSYDVTTASEHFDVNGVYSHNCRSFLSAWIDPRTGEKKWEGRFNQGVVTLNLPMVALDSGKDEDKFWQILEERLAICHEALMCRHKALEGTISDVSPIHWQDGAIARLKPGETIDSLLHGGFSTISLGYIGLSECVKYMTGQSHTEDGGREFSLRVMNRLKAACESWKAASGIGFGLYGTPAESTCYSLCTKIRKVYGVVEDITDKDWLTNSYHCDVREPITALDKFEKEAIYQKISSGGAISYVEIPNMTNNIEAVLSLMEFIYEKMQYAEFNTRSDRCNECGFEGEIKTNEDGLWECPKCGCKDKKKLTIVRRTCGYVGSDFWNVGKTKEINERVLHL